jgi:hypothetical protein
MCDENSSEEIIKQLQEENTRLRYELSFHKKIAKTLHGTINSLIKEGLSYSDSNDLDIPPDVEAPELVVIKGDPDK